jgi:hypothetical protein
MDQKKTVKNASVALCVLSIILSAPAILYGLLALVLLTPHGRTIEKMPTVFLILPLVTALLSLSMLIGSVLMKSRSGSIYLLIAMIVSVFAIILF